MRRENIKSLLFVSSILVLTIVATKLVSSALIITDDSFLVSVIWLSGFCILFFNLAHLFLLSVVYIFIKTPVLPEVFVKHNPKVALVYVIRNEKHGLFERMDYSLSGNKLPNLDLWILSDSTPDYEPVEQELVRKLREKYGDRVYYRRRVNHIERKQGNIKEFLLVHPEYVYMYVVDADGMVPRGVVLKLLRKAEHPGNRDIAIFQCFVKIAHARTWYAEFERIGARFAQKLYFSVAQAVYGRSISFGHHHLARTVPFRNIKLPLGLLSHDNWDTVLLDRMGYRVAFLPDCTAFDEAPANYLEARARDRRWSRGTLQGLPLIFMRGISLGSRFLAFYGIYIYLAQFVFFFWILLGLFAHSALRGQMIYFHMDTVWLDAFANKLLHALLFMTLLVVFGHKLVVVRSLRDFRDYIYELIFSTLVILNNCFYQTADIITLPFRSGKVRWKPMKKDPFARVSLGACIRNLWPTTLLGISGVWFCLAQTPYFVWQVSPLLLAMTISIPSAYFTARRMPEKVGR